MLYSRSQIRDLVSPGFAPRPSLSAETTSVGCTTRSVSPGFAPRPSLSGVGRSARHHGSQRVAGVRAPAFVERAPTTFRSFSTRRVSPGFAPRLSLSAPVPSGRPGRRQVSPGFAPRPSLSVAGKSIGCELFASVAGVRAPAFVERRADGTETVRWVGVSPGFAPRPSLSALRYFVVRRARHRVAGVRAPAFVERSQAARRTLPCARCRPASRPGLR